MDSRCNQKNASNNNIVTFYGNAWVICKSKSYAGRIYYFNTLTGEAAWNLSDAEVEKAKKRTDKVRLHAASNLENCPEPKDPPMDHCTSNPVASCSSMSDHIQPKIYGKHVINNSFPKSTHTQYVPCRCNNSVQPYVPSYNPNVWAIPTQPYFVTPTSIPQQNHTPINVPMHNMEQDPIIQDNVSFPPPRPLFANSRGRNLPNTYFRGNHCSPRGNRNNFGPRRNQHFGPQWSKNQNNSSDLRNLLSSRRKSMDCGDETRFNDLQESHNTNVDNSESTTDATLPAEPVICAENVDDQWLKEYCISENGKYRKDVTALKKLATKDAESESWYIVVDKDMVLDHYSILNMFINSDAQCRLLVTRDVLSQLQTSARAAVAPVKERARRALRFLSQQFASNCALIGDHSINPNEMKKGTGMFNFCLKLAEQNKAVILLSDNELLQTLNQNKVNVFCLNEIKEFLTNNLYRESYFKSSPFIDRSITITIPNTQPNNNEDEREEISNKEMEFVNDSNANLPKTRECDVQTEGFTKTKRTADIAVQTDFILEVSQSSVGASDRAVHTLQGRCESITCENTNDNLNANVDINSFQDKTTENSKKREIRLNRVTPIQTSKCADNNIEKRQFKWHRRKNIGSCSDNAVSTIDKDEQPELLLRLKQNPLTMSSESLSKSVNVYEDIIENSDTSSCIYMNRNVTQNIVIEETSISDVISNSASNDNSGTIQETMLYNAHNIFEKEQSKNVMFEITSIAMEKCLYTRRDEWLSRFVQIMEEVLSRILHNELKFSDSSMPAPWTLHEATQCIRKSFPYDCDVSDAAMKLSQVIFNISDKKGRLSMDIQPTQFMELYSYGVYLIDALQCIYEESYDLQAAAESLASLLNDIETPNTGHNDSLGDNLDEQSLLLSRSTCEVYKDTQALHVDDKTGQETNVVQNWLMAGYEANQNLRGNDRIDPATVAVHKSPDCSLNKKTRSPHSLQSTPTTKCQNSSPYKTRSTPGTGSKRGIDQMSNSSTDPEKYNLRSNKRRSDPEVNSNVLDKKQLNRKKLDLVDVNPKEVNQKQGNHKDISQIEVSRKAVNEKNFIKTDDVNQKKVTSEKVSHKEIDQNEVNQKDVNQKEVNQKGDGVRFIRKIDIQDEFFANLLLKRNTLLNNAKRMGLFEQNLDQFAAVANKGNNATTKEPCVIRNFSKCQDIEDRLKNKVRRSLDLDTLDYSMDYDDEYDYVEDEGTDVDVGDEGEDETDQVMVNTEIDGNQNYILFVVSIKNAIRNATATVHGFCEKIHKELSHTEIIDAARKQEIYKAADNAQLDIKSLCDSLKGILKREFKPNDKSCQTLLREVGVSIDDRHASQYTTMVAPWIDQVNTLLEAMNVVKDAVKPPNGVIVD